MFYLSSKIALIGFQFLTCLCPYSYNLTYANSNLHVSTLYNSNFIENKYVSRKVKRGWGKSVQRASVMLIEQRVIHLTISLTEQCPSYKGLSWS